jgi:hypothetical protein
MATEALNVIAATQLANRIDFVFINKLEFLLNYTAKRAKTSTFINQTFSGG